MKPTTILLFCLLHFGVSFANDSLQLQAQQRTIQTLQDDIKEVRRDQLNYQIEKNLLKETYSSNYTTVQLLISLILGIFAILGYLGLKNVNSLKKEYSLELDKLKDLKTSFELEFKKLTDAQQNVVEKIKSIDNLNESQNAKIKLLELKEKANSMYLQRNFQKALEYTEIGLSFAKDDLELLAVKASSLFKLKSYSEAISAHQKILSIDSSNIPAFIDLAELYLISSQIDHYTQLVKGKMDIFNYIPGLKSYLEAFRFYRLNDFNKLQKIIEQFISEEDLTVKKDFISPFRLADFYFVMKGQTKTKEGRLMIGFANYLEGKVPGEEVKKLFS